MVNEIELKVEAVFENVSPKTGELFNRSFLVSGCYAENELPKLEIVKLDKIRWFEDFGIPDANLTAKDKKLLLEKLQISASKASHVKRMEVSKSGVYEICGNTWYVLGNQCFKVKKQSDPEFELKVNNNFSRNYAWRIRPKDWKLEDSTIQKFLNVSPGCSEILFTATLFAAIKPILLKKSELAPHTDFIINVYGTSGSFKTSLVSAICVLSDAQSLRGSYAVDRKSDILKNLSSSIGFVYVLDDFHEQATDHGKKRQEDILNGVVRQEERIIDSGLVVTSSEYLDGIISTQDRCIQIQVKPVNTELLTSIQQCPYDMAGIVQKFVDEIVRHYDVVMDEIPSIFKKYTVNHRRIRADNYSAMLMTVAELFVKYVCVKGYDDYLDRLNKALEEQVEIQQQHLKQLKLLKVEGGDIAILLKMLYADVWTACTDSTYGHQSNEMLVILKERVHLTPKALKYGLKKYLRGTKIKSSDLIKSLMCEGILLCDGSGDSTKKVSYTGRRALMISIPNLMFFCSLNFPEDVEIKQIVESYHYT